MIDLQEEDQIKADIINGEHVCTTVVTVSAIQNSWIMDAPWRGGPIVCDAGVM